MNRKEKDMKKVDLVYYYALMLRNKIVYCADWLLMRVHTWRTGMKHNGADPRKIV
jgi:hypothetical protein